MTTIESSSRRGVGGAAVLTVLASAVWLGAMAESPALGGERSAYRSLREPRHDPIDELDLPRFAVRQTHQGWEVNTRHFSVSAATTREEAEAAARELESAWAEAGTLADQWTAVHRRPTFGISAVGVILSPRPGDPRTPIARGPRPWNDEPLIYIGTGGAGRQPAERRLELREEAFRVFLAVSGQDQTMPDWLQVGLAAYFADPQAAVQPPPRLDPLAPKWDDAARLAVRRTAPGPVPSPAEDRQRGVLWTRYLLLGDDGRHADALFEALAELARRAPIDGDGVLLRRPSGGRFATPAPPADSKLARLVAAADVEQGFRNWLADPLVGQPVVKAQPEDLPLGEAEREMILLLKLARRFPPSHAESVGPKVIERGVDRTAKYLGPATPPAPMSVGDLRTRLTAPDQPRWATIDTDGRLLLSTDRRRLDELFADANERYRTSLNDGRLVLERPGDGGETHVAWMEENRDQPERPIVHIERKALAVRTSARGTARP